MKKFKLSTKMICILALFIAMEVVLSRFLSINAWNIRIGFSFVPIAMVGMLYGALPAALVAGVADVVGATMFPSGPFFPGFTLTATLTGMVFGLFLHKKRTLLKTGIAICINQFVLSLLLNTLWISILYKSPFLVTVTGRLVQTAVMVPVQFVVIRGIVEALSRIGGELFFNESE